MRVSVQKKFNQADKLNESVYFVPNDETLARALDYKINLTLVVVVIKVQFTKMCIDDILL